MVAFSLNLNLFEVATVNLNQSTSKCVVFNLNLNLYHLAMAALNWS